MRYLQYIFFALTVMAFAYLCLMLATGSLYYAWTSAVVTAVFGLITASIAHR